jgi:hypothetical protein
MMIEVAADQHQLVCHRPGPMALVEGEPLVDEVENVSLLALVDADQAFGTKDIVRQLFEKMLKLIGRKRPVGFE